MVLHKCDVRHCVRPEHLFLGVQLDNMRDAAAKGRIGVAGSGNASAKLTEIDVVCIRRLEGAVSGRALARNFGVSATIISNIHRRRIWKHVV